MRDQRYENLLTQERVEFRYVPDMALGLIDEAASLENQARNEKLSPERVDRYTLAMKQGAEFPAVVGAASRSGYVLIDGNHRLQAAKSLGRKAIDMYDVRTTDLMVIARLTRMWNLLEGQTISQDEAISKAKDYQRRFHTTMREAAAIFRVKENLLISAVRADETRKRLIGLGIKTSASDAVLRRLAPLHLDKPLAAVEQLRQEAQLDSDQVQRLVSEVRAEGSEASQLMLVAARRESPDMQERLARLGSRKKAGTSVSSTRRRILRELERLLTAHPTHEALQLTGAAEIEEASEAWRRVSAAMGKVLHDARQSIDAHSVNGREQSEERRLAGIS